MCDKKFIFEALVTIIILYNCEVWGCNVFQESRKKTEKIQKRYISYITLMYSHVENISMSRYLMSKTKINNMED